MIDEKNLKIYKSAKWLEKEIRILVKNFPEDEKYCLTKQIRTAANSVGANIAEGSGRNSKPDFLRFLSISSGSLKEVKHHLEIAKFEKYLTEIEYTSLSIKINELGKMLNAFINSKQSN